MALAFLSGAMMGVLLTALGAGGSLFIVPILVIGFHLSVATATGTSLAVILVAAIAGAVSHWRQGRFRPRVALSVGLSAMLGAPLGVVLHAFISPRTAMLLFSGALCVAAVRMVRPLRHDASAPASERLSWQVFVIGFVIGFVTGFLGIGGGFLIVPALVLGVRLPTHEAIGTSLGVVAMACATGLVGYVAQGLVSTTYLAPVGLGAVVGALIGAPLSGRIPERPLRLGFAGLAVVAAVSLTVRAW